MNLPLSFRTALFAASLAAASLLPAHAGMIESVKGVFSSGTKPTPATDKAGAKVVWMESYDKALARAKAEKKLILLDITGSTWCPTCQAMEKEVFRTKAFKEYAEKNLVLLRLDFPDPVIDLSEKTQWALKYLPADGHVGLPLVVLVAADGRAIGTTSYAPGGPAPFIAELEKFARK
jgi:thiol:disulfide interchange protein